MPRPKAMIVAVLVAATAAMLGCGDSESEGDLPPDAAQTLLGQLQEVEDNVNVDSCFVAADEADNLIADIQALPDTVDGDLRQALENGAEQLTILLQDPDQCQRPEETTAEETTTEPSTTEEQTTTRETTTQPTTPTQPETTPTNPGDGSGGVGPGGTGQGGL